MAKQTQNNEKIKYNKFPLRKINFILMAVFGLMIVLGFILMAGSSNGEEFNPDIFSTRRITIAPITCLFGFVFMIYGVMRKPKNTETTANETEEGCAQ